MSGAADFYPYKINQSCRFNDDDSAYLTWLPAGAEADRKRWIWSSWIKRCNLPSGNVCNIFSVDQGSGYFRAFYRGTNLNEIRLQEYNGSSTRWMAATATNSMFRDPTSWHHVLISYDSTQVSSDDRIKLYINGFDNYGLTINTPVSLNLESYVGTADGHYIGRNDAGADEFDGYMAEPTLVMQKSIQNGDYAITDFGQSKSGIWIPKRYTGIYGTNGFHLDFANSGDLGNDVSGNNNDFTPSGLTADDQVLDSPTNNWCTWNGVAHVGNGTLREGNTFWSCGTPDTGGVLGTMTLPKTGKWYWEIIQGAGGCRTEYGVCTEEAFDGSYAAPLSQSGGWGVRIRTGDVHIYKNNNASLGDIGFTYAQFEVLQVAYDADTGKMWFGSDDDDWDGDPEAGTGNIITISDLTLDYFPFVSNYSTGDNSSMITNFGQLGFAHTPPTGFKALNSNNLPNPTIKDSSKGFETVTWDGDDVDGRDISGINFDVSAGALIWLKCRSHAYSHMLYDTLRGVGNDKELNSDNTNIEGGGDTENQGYLSTFNSDGFRVSDGAVSNLYVNDTGKTYVAWCFRMGVKYGFDIIADEGTGIAHAINHNIGGVPELIIRRKLNPSGNWAVYHYHALNKIDPETDRGILETSAAWADSDVYWNDTKPTTTQFTVGTYTATNEDTKNFITYLWRSIPQFSKVFSYIGNGNANGPFVYCGFRPRYLLIKGADIAGAWTLIDTARDIYNEATTILGADSTTIESGFGTANRKLDLLSNGFKIRYTTAGGLTDLNTNGKLYVGIAIAEQPGKYSNAR
jgi:hypothetical protein